MNKIHHDVVVQQVGIPCLFSGFVLGAMAGAKIGAKIGWRFGPAGVSTCIASGILVGGTLGAMGSEKLSQEIKYT